MMTYKQGHFTAAGSMVLWVVLLLTAVTHGQERKDSWGVRFADSILTRWPDPVSISKKGFEYEPGIVMLGVSRIYLQTQDKRYLDYVHRWVDHFVDPTGKIDWKENHNLDFIQPALLILFLSDETKEPKYATAARAVRERFDHLPKNADGGFWHKDIYPNEMWVDGIYMAEPFLVGYGRRFGDSGFCYDTALFQISLITQHVFHAGKGLVYHAWDQDRNAAWADPQTGLSPEFWCRGMGWFVMALVDILADLPKSHPGYTKIQGILEKLATGLKHTQDVKTGLWYQVLDKGDRPDNWLETSGSGIFIYSLKKGASQGLLDGSYAEVAAKGWKGLQSRMRLDPQGLAVIGEAVQGMGAQKDYAGYVDKQRLENSPHGLAAVLLAASQMER